MKKRISGNYCDTKFDVEKKIMLDLSENIK